MREDQRALLHEDAVPSDVVQVVVRIDDPLDRRARQAPDFRRQLLGGLRRREGVHDEHPVAADDEPRVAHRGAVPRLRDRRIRSFRKRHEREVRRPGYRCRRHGRRAEQREKKKTCQ